MFLSPDCSRNYVVYTTEMLIQTTRKQTIACSIYPSSEVGCPCKSVAEDANLVLVPFASQKSKVSGNDGFPFVRASTGSAAGL